MTLPHIFQELGTNVTPARRGYVLGVFSAILFVLALACQSTSVANQEQTDFTDRQTALLERGQPLHLYDY